ncbi:hypothetical protein DBB42_06845 [Pseudomonas plecoglossicida]|uniref:Uncharacterized protein n=1 Tax=Pseudomonas plecoglossicida TaxID=70775 RepID=A0A2R7ULM4_PSEDL|nr:hypothetical protein DBB42_06845 [Pseudomonas plecoglossicida]
MASTTRDPVGAGLPANAAVNPPTHSRVNPLPQGPVPSLDYSISCLVVMHIRCFISTRQHPFRQHSAP